MAVDILAVLERVAGRPLPTVVVEPYAGRSAYGDTYGAPVTITAWVDQASRLVRAADGSQVVSSTTVYTRLDAVDAPPRSRVTLPDGRRTLVIASYRRDGHGIPVPEHLEIVCE